MTARRLITALFFSVTLLVGAILMTQPSHAQADAKPALDATKSVAANLAALSGKSVTLHLRSGQTLSGVVGASSAESVLLTKLTGKEFYDALVSVAAIDGVEVRAR